MRAPTRLFIFTPTALYRQAWRALLSAQPDIEMANVAGTLAELGETPSGSTILVDLMAPHPDQVEQLRESNPQAGLLFLVYSYDLEEILPLLQAGATGCISRDASVADLARAIIAVGRGELSLPPEVAGRALSMLARGESPSTSLVEPLTGRERDVLSLLALGYSNKDIAQTLFLSVRTVEAHLRNIYGKLGVRSRTEAALWAVQQGQGLGK